MVESQPSKLLVAGSSPVFRSSSDQSAHLGGVGYGPALREHDTLPPLWAGRFNGKSLPLHGEDCRFDPDAVHQSGGCGAPDIWHSDTRTGLAS